MSSTPRRDTLLVVDDQPDAIETLRGVLEESGFEVLAATSREEAMGVLQSSFVDLLLMDERLGRASGTKLLEACRDKFPGLGGILITGHADLDCAVAAMRAGALDLLEKPINRQILLEAVSRALADSRLVRDARFQRWRATRTTEFPEIIGESDTLGKILAVIRQVAATSAPVLIQGESGTGKELVARAIHAASSRRDRAFLAVNAGAVPPTLMESTFFGSKKGAFTDSRSDQPGLFEAASGGTLFLDEIGETTPEVQVRLLRVLQEKTVTRVGDVNPIPTDVRVIAATNRDLRADADAKRFRSDLYFRLAVVTITIPPLRERLSDVEPIARHLLEKRSRELAKPIKDFAPACFDKLKSYRWPGNIRELDNVIQRAVILSEGRTIEPELLLLEKRTGPSSDIDALLDLGFHEAGLGFEELYFTHLLDRAGNNKTRAAELAGIDRTVLHAHLKKLRRGQSS